jgi:hypothetical protein
MPASQKRVITKLRERRRIEADLRKMLASSSELEFRSQAQQVASLGPQVIPAIVGSLNQADAMMLMALGTVATYLDHDEVAQALRRAVRQPRRTDQGRIGAMTILERFLDQPPDDDLMASLADPQGAALSSLEDILSEAEGNPAILVEYVQGLDRQEPDIVLAVVRALRAMAGAQNQSERGVQVVEPLRMLAQDVRTEIAAAALHALGMIRLPEAARALQTLTPIVAPPLRAQAERLVRKLQFTGVEAEPLPLPGQEWRALISPIDGLGQQSVWFIQESLLDEHARFLNVLLSDRAGAVEAVGHSQVSYLALPPRRSLGHMHDIALPDGTGAILMLETTFDLGRRLVLEGLAHNRETQIPIAGVLRLLSPWLWAYAGETVLAARVLPEISEEDDSQLDATPRLVTHPALATWTARTEATLQAAQEALHHPDWDREVWVKRLAGEMFRESALRQILSQRLTAMSEWLLLAGDREGSRLALVAAQALPTVSPQEHPFVQALVRRDLELASFMLKQQSGPEEGPELGE